MFKNFPVYFFKTGDSLDLSEKLLQIEKMPTKKLDFPKIYSFEKTFNIIQNTLEI